MNPIAPLLAVLGLAHASSQNRLYGIQILNPHNTIATVQVSAYRHKYGDGDGHDSQIAWLEDDPKVGLGINWRNFSDNINLGYLYGVYGLMELPCSALDSQDESVHVKVSLAWNLTCSGYRSIIDQCNIGDNEVDSEFCKTCQNGCIPDYDINDTLAEISFGLYKMHSCGDVPYLRYGVGYHESSVINVTDDWMTVEVKDLFTQVINGLDCPTYCQAQCTEKQVGTPTFGLSTRVFV